MAKRKADSQASATGSNGTAVTKKIKHDAATPKQAEARKNLLVESDSSGDDSDSGGAPLDAGFKVNEEYAKRFEYNKKREELARRMFILSSFGKLSPSD
jgi:protein KRI1